MHFYDFNKIYPKKVWGKKYLSSIMIISQFQIENLSVQNELDGKEVQLFKNMVAI